MKNKKQVFKGFSAFWQHWESETSHLRPLGAGLHQALHWLLWLLTDWQLL